MLTLLHASVLALGATTLPQTDGFRREPRPNGHAATNALEGKLAPPLAVEGWLNTDGKPLALSDLTGKVVLLDFFGTWCGPCVRAMPHLQALHAEHADEGLVVIGVSTAKGREKIPTVVEEKGLTYAICVDPVDSFLRSYHVNSFPDYYLVDRSGRLRFADLASEELDRAVQALLAEPAPASAPGPAALLARDFPSGRFDFLRDGQPIGTWEFQNEVALEEGAEVAVLRDVLELTLPGGGITYEVESRCAPDALLTPRAVTGRVKQGEQATDFSIAFEEKHIAVRFGEQSTQLERPADVIIDMALFRIATRMPFEAGAEVRFRMFELEDLTVGPEMTLRCEGPTELEQLGTMRACWKFVRPSPELGPLTLWVSPERRLLAVDWDGKKSLVPAASK